MSENADEKTYTEGYDSGYTTGYGSGFGAGVNAGYSDAKLRAYKALEGCGLEKSQERRAVEALTIVIGKL